MVATCSFSVLKSPVSKVNIIVIVNIEFFIWFGADGNILNSIYMTNGRNQNYAFLIGS